jgi:signal transduction histidine kinase
MSHSANGVRWRRSLWARAALIFGVWTVIGLAFSAQGYLAASRLPQPISWRRALFIQMSWSYHWALATPLILWLVRRLPLDRRHWLRNSAAHLLLSSLCAFAVGFLEHFILYLTYARPEGSPYRFQNSLQFVLGNWSEGVTMYMLIAFLAFAHGYYQKYQQGELRASKLEAQLSQAQLQALKMQLHPHFLFNTLHSISALLNKDTEAARTMIARLGDFLRLTLENSGTQEVTLKQEMEFLHCYLEIERIRFQDRLTTRIKVDTEALDVSVPNLILQPIVENAIRHAVAPRSSPGEIEIRARLRGELLVIKVRDNGPGLASNRNPERLFRKGLGLANTQTRLNHLYGTRHHFEIADDPAGGLAVTLEIPLTTGNDAPQPQADGDGFVTRAGGRKRDDLSVANSCTDR